MTRNVQVGKDIFSTHVLEIFRPVLGMEHCLLNSQDFVSFLFLRCSQAPIIMAQGWVSKLQGENVGVLGWGEWIFLRHADGGTDFFSPQGAIIFCRASACGGPEFFGVVKGGNFFFSIDKGGTSKKIGDQPSQQRPPPPGQKGTFRYVQDFQQSVIQAKL